MAINARLLKDENGNTFYPVTHSDAMIGGKVTTVPFTFESGYALQAGGLYLVNKTVHMNVILNSSAGFVIWQRFLRFSSTYRPKSNSQIKTHGALYNWTSGASMPYLISVEDTGGGEWGLYSANATQTNFHQLFVNVSWAV